MRDALLLANSLAGRREWNQVQDAWWWNRSSPPTVHCNRHNEREGPSLQGLCLAGSQLLS